MIHNVFRMYRNKLPNENDYVTVEVTKVDEIVAHCNLLEYGNKDSMILLSHLTKSRMRSVKKFIHPGKIVVMYVLQMGTNPEYVSLSKRNIQYADIEQQSTKYEKSKKVHSMLLHVSNTLDTPIADLYKNFGWKLYDKYDHAIDGLKEIVTKPSLINNFNIGSETKNELLKIINHNFAPKPAKIQSLVDVTCFTMSGVDTIIKAFKAGEQYANEIFEKEKLLSDNVNKNFTMQVYNIPTYLIQMVVLDENRGLDISEKIIDIIKENIHKNDGKLAIIQKPKVVT